MPKRTILWVPMLVILVATGLTARSSRAEPAAAAEDCITSPNSTPPQGRHWYYRTDRTANRRCWYLAPKDVKLRQAASPKRLPGPSTNLNQEQREVLFREFMKWQKQRDSMQR